MIGIDRLMMMTMSIRVVELVVGMGTGEVKGRRTAVLRVKKIPPTILVVR